MAADGADEVVTDTARLRDASVAPPSDLFVLERELDAAPLVCVRPFEAVRGVGAQGEDEGIPPRATADVDAQLDLALGLTGGPMFRGNRKGGNEAARQGPLTRTTETAAGRAALLLDRMLADGARTVNDLRDAAALESIGPKALDVIARRMGSTAAASGA